MDDITNRLYLLRRISKHNKHYILQNIFIHLHCFPINAYIYGPQIYFYCIINHKSEREVCGIDYILPV